MRSGRRARAGSTRLSLLPKVSSRVGAAAVLMSRLMQSTLELMKSLISAPGFDRVLEKVTLVSAAPGKVICEMKVESNHANKYGTLHGGFTATLVDDISTLALLCTERGVPGVSVDMNITYMSPAKIGEDIVITAHILKQGKTLAFTSVDLMNKTTGKLVAQGRHTKHLGNQDQHINWKTPNNKDQV